MTKIFSGIQPSGILTLGNYLGAINNWTKYQVPENNNLFCIVDLHAITTPQDSIKLKENIYIAAATYIACGINPKKSYIYPQSTVTAHSELSWILGCNTPLGWLNRMTQFKEKSAQYKENSGAGLYFYPVLMAADILLYDTDIVPVGEDQKQHVELARDIAGAFNRNYNQEFFKLPLPVIEKESARIMSLRDGTKKMSKSDESDYSRINLTDDADLIALKIKKAKTDSESYISYDPNNRPEVTNLINIIACLKNISPEQVVKELGGKGSADLKKYLTDVLIEKISPIGNQINELLDDKQYLKTILKNGSDYANNIANDTMQKVKKIVGLY